MYISSVIPSWEGYDVYQGVMAMGLIWRGLVPQVLCVIHSTTIFFLLIKWIEDIYVDRHISFLGPSAQWLRKIISSVQLIFILF